MALEFCSLPGPATLPASAKSWFFCTRMHWLVVYLPHLPLWKNMSQLGWLFSISTNQMEVWHEKLGFGGWKIALCHVAAAINCGSMLGIVWGLGGVALKQGQLSSHLWRVFSSFCPFKVPFWDTHGYPSLSLAKTIWTMWSIRIFVDSFMRPLPHPPPKWWQIALSRSFRARKSNPSLGKSQI